MCFRKIVLPALSGLLTGLSFNCSGLTLLTWFSLIPFIHSLSKSTLKEGILFGGVFSLVYYGTAIFWLTNVTRLGFIILLFYLSLFYILFSFFGRYYLNRPFAAFTLPALWVILEFLKENIGSGFGWANLGYSQYRNLYLIQVADLGGEKLVSFLILAWNVVIWELIFRRRRRMTIGKLLILFSIIFGCFGYSLYRLSNSVKEVGTFSAESADFLKVALVQPNIPQELKWEPAASDRIISRLEALAQQAPQDSLVVLPEAAWPFSIDKDNAGILERFVRDINKDILIGAAIKEGEKFYNAALYFDRRGRLLGSYRKIKLVPFGEYVPLRGLFGFIGVLNSLGDMSPGKIPERFVYQGKKFSVLICFEDTFPNYVAEVSRGNDFLINITNDAWFKGEPESGQHFGIMTFRAIENRIPIVRDSNTGISGWVSAYGRAEMLTADGRNVFFSGLESFNISLNGKKSFYNKYGEFFPLLCVVILLGVIGIGRMGGEYGRRT